MSRIDVNQAADIRAVMGATGTGKSHYVKPELAKAKRAIVWDMEDEYTDLPAVSLAELPAVLHRAGQGAVKVRFVPSTDEARRKVEFDLFCRTAMAIGKLLIVAEELRFVTEPSRSPSGWAGINLRGRKRGLKVIGTSQRPASIDKDFLSNATFIRCGALGFPPDRSAVAAVMGIDPALIEQLEGFEAITWQRTPRKITLPPRLAKVAA